MVTVTGVTLGNTNTPAVLTALKYPTILCCIQAGIGLKPPWRRRRRRKRSRRMRRKRRRKQRRRRRRT